MKARRVIVIGGGPAGLMAAGQAAQAGADTLLLEKMKRTGLKLCITGKGRCNVTNNADAADFISRFGKTGPFLRQAFARFFNSDLIDFFNQLDLKLVTERGGRVFPASGNAPSANPGDSLARPAGHSTQETRPSRPLVEVPAGQTRHLVWADAF